MLKLFLKKFIFTSNLKSHNFVKFVISQPKNYSLGFFCDKRLHFLQEKLAILGRKVSALL